MVINYRDAAGGWQARLDKDGQFLGGVLVEPSAEFESTRPAPPAPAPDLELDALRGILVKADADVTTAELKTVALRMARRLERRGVL